MANFEDFMRISEECLEDIEQFERSPFNLVLNERLRKTLYFGIDTPASGHAHPLTDLATQLFKNSNQGGTRPVDTKYVSNVARKSSISPCTLMVAIIYLERLRHKNPNYLHNVASADLFLVTMMIATKFAYDEGEDEEMFNDEWAKAGNLDTESVHKLEEEFLKAIDWDLFVKPADFLRCLNQVEQTIALNEGSRRGWFSYTDLTVLLGNASYQCAIIAMLENLIKTICACVLTYSFLATSAVFYVVAFSQSQPPTLDALTHHLLFGSFANSATQANDQMDSTYMEIILKTNNLSTKNGLEDDNIKSLEEPLTDRVRTELILDQNRIFGLQTKNISFGLELQTDNSTNNNGQAGTFEHGPFLGYKGSLKTWTDLFFLVSHWLYNSFTCCTHLPNYFVESFYVVNQ